MTTPYNDDYLVYDYKRHKYYLTEKAVNDNINNGFFDVYVNNSMNRQADILNILKQVCDTVYREIQRYNSSQYFNVEYIMAKSESARTLLLDAFLEQVRYFDFNGLIDVYAGVDFKKGTKSQDYTDRILSPSARVILSTPIHETGIPLLYSGKYAFVIKPNYEKENY